MSRKGRIAFLETSGGIRKHGENLTLEMKTPFGSDARRQAAYSQAAKDYGAANKKRVEKYFGDNDKKPLITSRDIKDKSIIERREPTKGRVVPKPGAKI